MLFLLIQYSKANIESMCGYLSNDDYNYFLSLISLPAFFVVKIPYHHYHGFLTPG